MSEFTDVYELWIEAVRAAFSLARGRRLAQLRGDYVPSFDPQGLHPYSQEWGRILAFEALEPLLGNVRYMGDPYLTPMSLRKMAEGEATDTYREALLNDLEAEK